MLFRRIPYRRYESVSSRGETILIDDNWDDFGFRTTFRVIYFDAMGARLDIGTVKIAMRGMREGRTDCPSSFSELPPDYFSLGQEQTYYENLLALPLLERNALLIALRDVVYDPTLRADVSSEDAFDTSLCRNISPTEIDRFSEILLGTYRKRQFSFTYLFPRHLDVKSGLEFCVDPDSVPPTNIHVVIGRNGVGKTHLLTGIANAVCGNPPAAQDDWGQIIFPDSDSSIRDFADVITVAFSAFDTFRLPSRTRRGSSDLTGYVYVGLRQDPDAGQKSELKSLDDLLTDFVTSVTTCLRSSRADRWRTAIDTLGSDPGFSDIALPMLSGESESVAVRLASEVFQKCSSGHKIVLLTITRLVEHVDDRSLVLIDEPESHLHPPLLSSFVRALSELLSERNGAAIIATHSPVVLQEVPSSCVWMLNRTGDQIAYLRPSLETFAENVGVLTREVFGLEVTESGYHALLREVANSSFSYDHLLLSFSHRLGSEGRAIALALLGGRR